MAAMLVDMPRATSMAPLYIYSQYSEILFAYNFANFEGTENIFYFFYKQVII